MKTISIEQAEEQLAAAQLAAEAERLRQNMITGLGVEIARLKQAITRHRPAEAIDGTLAELEREYASSTANTLSFAAPDMEMRAAGAVNAILRLRIESELAPSVRAEIERRLAAKQSELAELDR